MLDDKFKVDKEMKKWRMNGMAMNDGYSSLQEEEMMEKSSGCLETKVRMETNERQ